MRPCRRRCRPRFPHRRRWPAGARPRRRGGRGRHGCERGRPRRLERGGGGPRAPPRAPRRSDPRQRLARHWHRRGRRPPEGGVRLMLYYLHHLSAYFPVLNVTRYITFRTAAASLTALAIGLCLGPWMIRRLREFQIGQVIRQEGPSTHRTKAGT